MISNKKELYNYLDGIFCALGYVRKRNTWYFLTEECICFFVIEKSDYSGSFGDAFGCFVKELPISSGKEFPEYYKSHLRISLSFFVDNEIAEKIFDLENQEFKNHERETVIHDLIVKHTLPFLKTISTKQGIKDVSEEYAQLKYYMYAALREAIGISDDD